MERLVIKSMSIDMQLDGSITHVIGPTDAGKTYLLKKLINVINNKDIYLDDKCIKDYDIDYLKNNIVVCLNDEEYHSAFVIDELGYYLSLLNYSNKEINERIKKIISFFNLEDIAKSRIAKLNVNKRILVKVLSYLIIEPTVFGVDNLLVYLNQEDKANIYKYLKKKHITSIIVTSDLDDLIYGTHILIMNHMKCLLYGDNKVIIDNNSIIPYMGIRLPFAVDLSQNLNLYNIIDKLYLDKSKLVNKIWK